MENESQINAKNHTDVHLNEKQELLLTTGFSSNIPETVNAHCEIIVSIYNTRAVRETGCKMNAFYAFNYANSTLLFKLVIAFN